MNQSNVVYKNVMQLIEFKNLRITDVERAAGVKQSYISHLKNDIQEKNVDRENLSRLAAVLFTTSEFLLDPNADFSRYRKPFVNVDERICKKCCYRTENNSYTCDFISITGHMKKHGATKTYCPEFKKGKRLYADKRQIRLRGSVQKEEKDEFSGIDWSIDQRSTDEVQADE